MDMENKTELQITEENQSLAKRATQEWSKLAKEPIEVEIMRGWFYVFGSELACLRLFYEFRKTEGVRVDWSINRKSWYFSKEKNF